MTRAPGQASRKESPELIKSRVTRQTRKSQVTRACGPGSLSMAKALRYVHLPNGPPSFSGPKGKTEHCYNVGQCSACRHCSSKSPLEEQNPPTLIFEMKRQPKSATAGNCGLGFGLPR